MSSAPVPPSDPTASSPQPQPLNAPAPLPPLWVQPLNYAAPPLPSELGQLTKDLQAFVDDYGKKLDAESGGDDAGAVASQAGVDADLAKIAKYTIDSIGKQIDDFYRPMIARFNLEIAAATA